MPASWQVLKTEEYESRLSYLTKRLKRCLRRFDTCYRLDSDVFVVLLPHSTENVVDALCENLMDDLEGSGRFEGLADIRLHRDVYSPEDDVDVLIERIERKLNDQL